jgi:predicted short-subunit dehydrogenase-like oxidoreductase (DUF2520 family)
MLRLNAIGCGNVGRTLCRLWHRKGIFEIGRILNRSADSASRACAFIGNGRPASGAAELGRADLYMIAAPDDAIEDCARQLALSAPIDNHTVVFHCSGSKSSRSLAAVQALGARTASIHPLKSFADPEHSVDTFAGTHCALEGDVDACRVLEQALGACGASCFRIESRHKMIYHAANVFASNYLVALLDAAFRCYEQAGVPAPRAMEIVQPLIEGTLQNVSRLGTVQALTGPVARGDAQLVEDQLRELSAWDRDLGTLYTQLGRHAVGLARRRHHAPSPALDRIAERLGEWAAGGKEP